MRTLEKDGCIAVHERAGGDRRPERTTYVLTGEGETEYQVLLRESWWTVTAAQGAADPRAVPDDAPPAGGARPRRCRRAWGALEGHARRDLLPARGDPATAPRAPTGEIPEHVREIMDFASARIRAELDWSRGLQRRLRDGAYRFTGEDGFPELGPGKGVRSRSQA